MTLLPGEEATGVSERGEAESHPVLESVNVNVAVPNPTAVTNPLLSIVAIVGLLLVQLPPEAGII